MRKTQLVEVISVIELYGGIIKFLENEINTIKNVISDFKPNMIIKNAFDIANTWGNDQERAYYGLLKGANYVGGLFNAIYVPYNEEGKYSFLSLDFYDLKYYNFKKAFFEYDSVRDIEIAKEPVYTLIDHGSVPNFLKAFYSNTENVVNLQYKFNSYIYQLSDEFEKAENSHMSLINSFSKEYESNPTAAKIVGRVYSDLLYSLSTYLNGKITTSETLMTLINFMLRNIESVINDN